MPNRPEAVKSVEILTKGALKPAKKDSVPIPTN